MRAAFLVVVATLVLSVAGGSIARADAPHVVMLGHDDALRTALQVALVDRGVGVASLPSPDGALRLDRAAVAQRAALSSDAEAGVWIEDGDGAPEVCVVSSDGSYFRHAPLPAGSSPRVFAAIAASLLDEILAPPEAPPTIDVDVHVAVGPGAAPPPSARPPIAPPPPSAPGMIATTGTADRGWSDRTLVELGPVASPVSIGFEGEVAFPLASWLRLGGLASESLLLDGVNDVPSGSKMFVAGGELRAATPGATHLEIGFVAAGAYADEGDAGGLFAVRVSAVWQGRNSGVSLSLAPGVLVGFRGNSPELANLMASVRWEVPL